MVLVGSFMINSDERFELSYNVKKREKLCGQILLHNGVLRYVAVKEFRNLYWEKQLSNVELSIKPLVYYSHDVELVRLKLIVMGKQSFAQSKKICLTPSLVVLCAMNDKVIKFWRNCKYYTLGYTEFINYLTEHNCEYCNFSIDGGKIEITTDEKVAWLKDYSVSKIESVLNAHLAKYHNMLGMYKFTFPGNVSSLDNNITATKEYGYIYACYKDKETGKFTYYRMYSNGVREKANFTGKQKKYLRGIFNRLLETGRE